MRAALLLAFALAACEPAPIFAPRAEAGADVDPASSVAISVAHVCDSCYERGKLEEQTREARDKTMQLQAEIAGLQAQIEALTREHMRPKIH